MIDVDCLDGRRAQPFRDINGQPIQNRNGHFERPVQQVIVQQRWSFESFQQQRKPSSSTVKHQANGESIFGTPSDDVKGRFGFSLLSDSRYMKFGWILFSWKELFIFAVQVSDTVSPFFSLKCINIFGFAPDFKLLYFFPFNIQQKCYSQTYSSNCNECELVLF